MDAQASELLAHLPYLRRYARALAGDAGLGDTLVSEMITIVMEGAESGQTDVTARLPLYALLNRLFDQDGGTFRAGPDVHPMEAALALLPELDRRLFLLVNLEAMPLAEAGEILGLPATEARDRMARTQEAVRQALVASIMIVEDDAIIAFDLAETVRGMGHRVCGTAATVDGALSTARECQPTLALMDLRLAHGDSGIDCARALRRNSSLPIIFVTAFADELQRRGLEHLGPIIRKPFSRDEIERAITQAVFAPQADARIPALAAFAERRNDRERRSATRP